MRRINVAIILVGLFAILTACAGAQEGPTMEINDAWVRSASTMAGMTEVTPESGMGHEGGMGMGFNSAAYMMLVNRGKTEDRLLRASSPVAQTVELHETTMTGDVMSMQQVNYIDVPAGGQVELMPGGLHIMLIGLNQDLNPGEKVPLQLVFENAGEINLDAEVRAP